MCMHPTSHLQAWSGLASLEHGSQRCPAGLGQQAQELEHSQRSPQSQVPVEHLGQLQCFPMMKSGRFDELSEKQGWEWLPNASPKVVGGPAAAPCLLR